MFWNRLPHPDKIYRTYLSPWYLKGEQPICARPDWFISPEFKGEELLEADLNKNDKAHRESEQVMEQLRGQAVDRLSEFVPIKRMDLATIHSIDEYFTKDKVKELLKSSKAKDPDNPTLFFIGLLGTALGDEFVKSGKFVWNYQAPYFNSTVVNLETGTSITVYNWIVKKFSNYGINDGIKWKFEQALEMLK